MYPAKKRRGLTEREKVRIRERIRLGDGNIWKLAGDFDCSASQIAGIKAAVTKGQEGR